MQSRWAPILAFVIVSSYFHSALTSPTERSIGESIRILLDRRHDHHLHQGGPLLVLNETQVLTLHSPTPPSYYTIDWEDDGRKARYGAFMILHGISMCLAFFVSLPLSIALRSVKHAAHGMVILSFYGFCALGCAASGIYRKLTPNMYEHAIHRSQGYFIILIAVLLSILDILSAIRRSIVFLKSSDKSFKNFWRIVVKNEEEHVFVSEYVGLVEGAEDIDSSKLSYDSVELQSVHLSAENHNARWPKHARRHSSEPTVFGTGSPKNYSDDTLHEVKGHRSWLERCGIFGRIGHAVIAIIERALVIGGFGQLLIGIVTYTGGCREKYLNGCLAHLIKGGIFWCYGLLTFARFLGAFADRGWAWNISPLPNAYSAEFVESLVIFGYGISNTWMERFGVESGDPYTTKQIQHISIAVMFWFAGLIGMAIESKRVRKWLASLALSGSHAPGTSQGDAKEPQSYRTSFNPFPALVIGVTGAAMAAHHQTYLFQVQIHALWGNLLVAFSVLRCFTYFFLWLGPPKAVLPSRPPTEAVGSFFLACGGLVFMLSTEEVTFAAMRRDRDDIMMFLNVAVAITCLAFCWTLCIVGFKGWLRFRKLAGTSF